MSTFIEYELDDGTSVLVAAPEVETSGIVQAARGPGGEIVLKAGRKFGEALEAVRGQAAELRHKLEDLRADEVEVSFSLTATGEAGNFAIGSVGVEAAYKITLKWKNVPQKPRSSSVHDHSE